MEQWGINFGLVAIKVLLNIEGASNQETLRTTNLPLLLKFVCDLMRAAVSWVMSMDCRRL